MESVEVQVCLQGVETHIPNLWHPTSRVSGISAYSRKCPRYVLVQDVGMDGLAELLATHGSIVLDVRNSEEHALQSVPGAMGLPHAVCPQK